MEPPYTPTHEIAYCMGLIVGEGCFSGDLEQPCLVVALHASDPQPLLALRNVFGHLPLATDRPSAVICHTVKGKGIAFAENDASWHHKSKIAKEIVTNLYAALE